MEFVKKSIRHVGMEVPLGLYMLTSFFKTPVFQNLIYEKLCLERYDNLTFCSNISAYYKDAVIQTQASHFYSYSSYTLVFPSLISTLLLGVASDYWSVKIPLLIPFLGLILNTVNYIIQSVYIDANVYLLLISDAIFGICGGYISIISTTMSYGVKTTRTTRRSYRIAGMEGAIGFGGTIGYALSGTIREALGYSWAFVLMLILQVIAFFYIVLVAKDPESEISEETEAAGAALFWERIKIVFFDFYHMLTVERATRMLIFINLLALGTELLIFAGLGDIQYSYLRYKLAWGDKEYGWFSGLSLGLATITVWSIYPFLHFRGVSVGLLGCFGMVMKIASLFMLAFVVNSAMAYSITLFTMFNRFVSSGFRAFLSSLIETHEQGKMFSLVALLEGATSLLATTIYNNLYPITLNFFPGFLYILSAALLLPSMIILGYSDTVVKRRHLSYASSTEQVTIDGEQ